MNPLPRSCNCCIRKSIELEPTGLKVCTHVPTCPGPRFVARPNDCLWQPRPGQAYALPCPAAVLAFCLVTRLPVHVLRFCMPSCQSALCCCARLAATYYCLIVNVVVVVIVILENIFTYFYFFFFFGAASHIIHKNSSRGPHTYSCRDC